LIKQVYNSSLRTIFQVNPLLVEAKEIANMAARTISPLNAFLMLCLITFWGSSFVIVKATLREGMSPVAIATFRFLTAGGLFITALLLNKIKNSNYVLLVDKKDVPTLVVLALTGVTFFFTIQYTGILMASASLASILVCLLSPILISIISARIFKERLATRQILGISIAAMGTLAVVTGGALNLQNNTSFFSGTLILLSTPFLWATYTLIGKKIMEKYSPFLVVAYVNILGGLCLVPFSLAENSFHEIFTLNLQEWSAILFLAFTCSLLGYFIWFYVIKQVRAAVTSSFMFGEPLITVLFATIFIREEMTPFTVIGGLLIFVGVYLVSRQ
jgi:drug/metabolite transporter (DMT)-like permease